ncbi:MAG: bifunctional isocitrate dehydrogenase kinase/phosphatase [Candidatus Dormibacterales bacterium]
MGSRALDLPATRFAAGVPPVVVASFDGYQDAFEAIGRRARRRFEHRDWQGAVADARERLDLYGAVIDRVEARVREVLGARVADKLVWARIKAAYSALIAGRDDAELAETFFNSITRRVFTTQGVDGEIEFVDSDFEAPLPQAGEILRTYEAPPDAIRLLESILADGWFEAGFDDLSRDARLGGERLARELRARGAPGVVERAEVLAAPFFRRKGAYLLGRIFSGRASIPLALALLNTERGVVVDALLTDEDDISILFSFTRSHFHVDLGPPHRLVRYLKLIMPRKSVAELYIALGHHKHGKTELYRDLLRHLRETDEKFEFAPGTPGMVMVVFTMPGHDMVFKVIRDRFPVIKPMTPGMVRDNYRLVFRHDRAGRLVEAQEFEHLEFERARFSDWLLGEFRRDADRTVSVDGDTVVLHHVYLERRVSPLDVHLRAGSRDEGRRAVLDFGQAVKDLAANGIFPGELLPKNFGVTRHGRVVCYDYDELSFLTDFTFRPMPQASRDEDEYEDGSWFGVGPKDLFPEEFSRFLGLPPPLGEILQRGHGDLYEVGFWKKMQARVRGGEIIDIFPYAPGRRLRPRWAGRDRRRSVSSSPAGAGPAPDGSP